MKIIRTRKNHQKTTPSCNCRDPETCELDKQFITNTVIYETEITATPQNKSMEKNNYVGLCEDKFKRGYGKHVFFLAVDKSNEFKLASHVWNLKSSSTPHTIKWSIVEKFKSFVNGSKKF